MKNILVLGASGMLGSMLVDFLSRNDDFQVFGTFREESKIDLFPDLTTFNLDILSNFKEQLDFILSRCSNIDYIINAIGIIKPYCNTNDSFEIQQAIQVNSIFPHELSNYFYQKDPLTKIITIATDCVYDGKKGFYVESDLHNPTDVYGKTKSLGEVCMSNTLNFRCSIIGPEKYNKLSILEWFLNTPEHSEISGFENHQWNGVTTLQFAELCEQIILKDSFQEMRSKNSVIHYVINEDVNKYELLDIFRKTFGHSINIQKTNTKAESINRTIRTKFLPLQKSLMSEAITELKNYIGTSTVF